MTPTSPLAGLLTGAVDGLLVAFVVFAIILLAGRRRRVGPAVVHPVAEDLPVVSGVGEMPRPYSARE